jgi:hypothetical protein
VETFQEFLKSLPRGVLRVGLMALAEYIVGNQRHGLKHYQPYKYVSRKQAYGKSFVSDKQRRYVMARIREGTIDPGVPHRTGQTQRAWVIKVASNGYSISVGNPTPGAYFTRHDTGQARQLGMAGWLKTAQVIANNLAGALRHARAEVGKFTANRKKLM